MYIVMVTGGQYGECAVRFKKFIVKSQSPFRFCPTIKKCRSKFYVTSVVAITYQWSKTFTPYKMCPLYLLHRARRVPAHPGLCCGWFYRAEYIWSTAVTAGGVTDATVTITPVLLSNMAAYLECIPVETSSVTWAPILPLFEAFFRRLVLVWKICDT